MNELIKEIFLLSRILIGVSRYTSAEKPESLERKSSFRILSTFISKTSRITLEVICILE
jgi:hypothetical protein